MVRGPAFAGVDRGTWDWVDRGSHGSIRATIDQTVTDLAVTVAEGAIDAADPDLALWATGRGLEVLPGSDTLHRLTLQAAALDIRRRDRLDQAWTAVCKSLRSIGETPSSDLVDLYHDLRSRRAGSR